jgi:pyridoxine kinase
MLHGTGDVFASTLLAAVMTGKDLAQATTFAADFTADAMVVSAKQPHFEERGVSFEPLLGQVTQLLA